MRRFEATPDHLDPDQQPDAIEDILTDATLARIPRDGYDNVPRPVDEELLKPAWDDSDGSRRRRVPLGHVVNKGDFDPRPDDIDFLDPTQHNEFA